MSFINVSVAISWLQSWGTLICIVLALILTSISEFCAKTTTTKRKLNIASLSFLSVGAILNIYVMISDSNCKKLTDGDAA